MTESNERTNEHTNGRTDKRQGESYIPIGINTGGINTDKNSDTLKMRTLQKKMPSWRPLAFWGKEDHQLSPEGPNNRQEKYTNICLRIKHRYLLTLVVLVRAWVLGSWQDSWSRGCTHISYTI